MRNFALSAIRLPPGEEMGICSVTLFSNIPIINAGSVRVLGILTGKYLNFSVAFFRTGKSLKMVGGPEKSWKSVNSSNEVFLKDIEEQPDGKIQQLKNT